MTEVVIVEGEGAAGEGEGATDHRQVSRATQVTEEMHPQQIGSSGKHQVAAPFNLLLLYYIF